MARKLDLVSLVDKARVSRFASDGDLSLTQWLTNLQGKVSLPVNPELAKRRRLRDDRLDRIFTHPWLGLIFFAVVMTLIFGSVFWLAQIPMEAIDVFFGSVAKWVSTQMSAGPLRDLLVDGVIGGVSGTLVFLPQILMLFFLVSILEETGYLARAAFVADRWLRPFGLPGQAFVPLLSSHACAIPAILCTRLIPDRRDRIATILVAPFSVLFCEAPGLHFDGRYPVSNSAVFCRLCVRWLLSAGSLRCGDECRIGPDDFASRSQHSAGAGVASLSISFGQGSRQDRPGPGLVLSHQCWNRDSVDLYFTVVVE